MPKLQLILLALFLLFQIIYATADFYDMPPSSDTYIEYTFNQGPGTDEAGPSAVAATNSPAVHSEVRFFQQIQQRNRQSQLIMKMSLNHGYRVLVDLPEGSAIGTARAIMYSADSGDISQQLAQLKSIDSHLHTYGTTIRCNDVVNDKIMIHKIQSRDYSNAYVADICKLSGIKEPGDMEMSPQGLLLWIPLAQVGYTASWHVRYSTMGQGLGRRLDFDNNNDNMPPVPTVEYTQAEIEEDEKIAKECAICFEEMQNGGSRVARCHRHFFHTNCLNSWLQHRPSSKTGACPTCRR